jgi:hypothetical protein
MHDWQEWTDTHGTPLEPDQAWRMFGDWKTAQKQIGLRFISQLSRFRHLWNFALPPPRNRSDGRSRPWSK